MSSVVDFTSWSKRIPRRKLIDRDAYFLQACQKKEVVHLGASDAPFADDRMKKGELLHAKLQKAGCKSLVGIDYDQESITILKEKWDISDILQRDLSKADPSLAPMGDLILCGDIIEHVNNVGDLMYNCNKLCRKDGTLLVSTINAMALRMAMRAIFSKEAVHPDHVAYYSISNLGVMLNRWGWEVTDMRFFAYGSVSYAAGMFFGSVFKFSPQSADGVLAIARKVREV